MPTRAIVFMLVALLAASRAHAGAAAPTPLGDGFVSIPLGTFLMGTPPDEPGRFDDETQHAVTLTRPYAICDHAVTQAEWESVMGWNPAQFAGCPECPVETVTWYDCLLFCNRLSQRAHLAPAYRIDEAQFDSLHCVFARVRWERASLGYRLPTEAEWERAVRAGTTTAFYGGPVTTPDPRHCSADSVLDRIAWYCINSGRRTHPVKTKEPNAWGLYDMAGNVHAWCWDCYLPEGAFAQIDPEGPADGPARVWKGGGWGYQADHCRSGHRGRDQPELAIAAIGMRLARTLPAAPAGVKRIVR